MTDALCASSCIAVAFRCHVYIPFEVDRSTPVLRQTWDRRCVINLASRLPLALHILQRLYIFAKIVG